MSVVKKWTQTSLWVQINWDISDICHPQSHECRK